MGSSDTLITLVSGAVSGAVVGYSVVKLWLARAEARFQQVEDHETRLTVLERSVADLVHSVRRVDETVHRVANDVSYIRGAIQHSSEGQAS